MDANDYYYDLEGVSIGYAMGEVLLIHNEVEWEEVSSILEHVVGGANLQGANLEGVVDGAVDGVVDSAVDGVVDGADYDGGHDRQDGE